MEKTFRLKQADIASAVPIANKLQVPLFLVSTHMNFISTLCSTLTSIWTSLDPTPSTTLDMAGKAAPSLATSPTPFLQGKERVYLKPE